MDDFLSPGADPAIFLQSTNMSVRRTVDERPPEGFGNIDGFDQHIEYLYDDLDISILIIERTLAL